MTEPAEARRILVYGVTGSGKSTAAARIAATSGLPLILVDELTWEPGWVPVPDQHQRELFADVAAADAWVLDNAYGAWIDVVLPRVELVVGLDFPRWFSLQRLVRRTLVGAIDQEPRCNGNTESLRNLWPRNSIVSWHFQSFARKRRRMRQWAESPDGPPVMLVKSARDLERWMREFENSRGL